MTAVYLQPAANPVATENVRRTLYRPIDRDALVKSIGQRAATIEAGRLEDVSDYPSAWGAKSAHFKRWREMQPGDLVVFYGGGQVFAAAEVSVTIHSSHLGRLFWDDPAWEYVFLLESVRRTHFALSDLYGHGSTVGTGFRASHGSMGRLGSGCLLGANSWDSPARGEHRSASKLPIAIVTRRR